MTLLPPLTSSSATVRVLSAILSLSAFTQAVMAFVLQHEALVFDHLFLLSGLLGLLAMSGGAFGIFRKTTPAKTWSLMLSAAACYGLIIFGGTSFFFIPHIGPELDSLLEIEYANKESNSDLLQSEEGKMKVFLMLNGIASSVVAILAGLVSRNQISNLGTKRSNVAILQTFSMCSMPLAFILILGGHYIVESQTLSSSPTTGVFMFICGIVVMLLSIFAFVGSAFEYRRLLSFFIVGSFVTSTILIGGAIATFAMSSSVKTHILNNWDKIRIVLPPTLQAKYDEVQFLSLVEANLYTFAFVALVTGWFLSVQSNNATVLKTLVNASKLQLLNDQQTVQEMKEHVPDVVTATEDTNNSSRPGCSSTHFNLRMRWHQHHQVSRKRHRVGLRLCVCVGSICLLVIISVMSTSVIFASQCSSISKASSSMSFPLASLSTIGQPNVSYNFENYYSTGLVNIVQGNSSIIGGLIQLTGFALKSEFTSSVVNATSLTSGNSPTFTVYPASDPPALLWVDLTCQEAILNVMLPTVPRTIQSRTLDVYSETSVSLNLRDSRGDAYYMHRVNLSSQVGNLDLYGVYASGGGIALETSTGDISVTESVVNGESAEGYALTHISSSYGQISLTNLTLVDCMLNAFTAVGQVSVSNIKSFATHGWSRVSLSTQAGSIYVDEMVANSMDLSATEDGAIRGTNVVISESIHNLGSLNVKSKDGDIILKDVTCGGYVHLESSTGDIYLHLKTYSFRGLFYMRSELGSMTITKGAYSFDSYIEFNETSTDDGTGAISNVEKSGTINCGEDDNSCFYVGDIHLISYSGNIHVVIGCEDIDCD